MLPGFLERWKNDWIDPALDYIDGPKAKSDSHLNDVSIEYSEDAIQVATQNFSATRLLGSGTFGSVYRGTMGDGTEVAIKVLQVPEEAGFEDEVKVLSRFRHPNLVILMGFARHNETGGRSLIYEYLAGGDVSKRLQKSRQLQEPFEWRQRLSAAIDASCGLSHLHNMTPRAFHRDIKGPNILLDRNGTAKMADFGLSCVAVGAQHKVRQASGTVGYACPEYIRTGIITEGSEVHSFGMVLLELLTGAPPAVQRPDKPNEFCYLVDHLQGSAAKVVQMMDQSAHFPADVSQALTEIAFRCITLAFAERPLFKQLVEELRALYMHSTADDGAKLGHDPLAVTQAVGMERRPSGQQGQPQPQQRANGSGMRRVVLAVGTPVECKGRGRSGPAGGRIARVNTNGTFSVRYNDGELEDNVAAQVIRPVDAARRQPGTEVQQHRGGYGPPPPPAAAGVCVVAPNLAASSPPRREVAPPAPRPREDVTCRLWCVYSEGVELSKLSEVQRSVPWKLGSMNLIVGRTAQPASFWDTLVPDRRLHGTISREHFRIKVTSERQDLFCLTCSSLNGVLLNSRYVGQGEPERPLHHGDVIAFAASVEPTGGGMRKPFIVFSFEVIRSPMAPSAPPEPPSPSGAVPPPPPPPARDQRQEELEVQPMPPPENCIAGWWQISEALAPVPDDALFALEVHGDGVRMDLPSKARQLLYRADLTTQRLPALRVGRGYQRLFWERVLERSMLEGGCWTSAMAADHFQVSCVRRATAEPNGWGFRMQVLAATCVCGVACIAGEERELQQSDVLTIGGSSSSAASVPTPQRPSAARGGAPGVHFTFTRFVGSTLEKPRQLPESSAFWGNDAAVDDAHGLGSSPGAMAVGSGLVKEASVLKPPMPLPLDADGDDDSEAESRGRPSGVVEYRTVRTRILDQPQPSAPDDSVGELVDPDDLFARTGFQAGRRANA